MEGNEKQRNKKILIISLVVIQAIGAIVGGVLKIVYLNHFGSFNSSWFSIVYWLTKVMYFFGLYYLLTLLKTKKNSGFRIKITFSILTGIIFLIFWLISMWLSIALFGPIIELLILKPIRTAILIISYIVLIRNFIDTLKQNKQKQTNKQYWKNRY